MTTNKIFSEIDTFNKLHKKKISLYNNPLQEFCFYGALCIFIFSVLFFMASIMPFFGIQTNSLLSLIALFLFMITEFLVIIYQMSTTLPDAFKTLKDPMHVFLHENSEKFDMMKELSTKLSSFSVEDLELAESLIKMESTHLKNRIGLLVGAMETIGIIPVIITTGISIHNLLSTVKIPYVDAISYPLLILYFFMLYFNLFSHRLEKLAMIINHSLKFKLTKT